MTSELFMKEQEQADMGARDDRVGPHALATSGDPPCPGVWENTTGDQHPAGLLRELIFELSGCHEGSLSELISTPLRNCCHLGRIGV